MTQKSYFDIIFLRTPTTKHTFKHAHEKHVSAACYIFVPLLEGVWLLSYLFLSLTSIFFTQRWKLVGPYEVATEAAWRQYIKQRHDVACGDWRNLLSDAPLEDLYSEQGDEGEPQRLSAFGDEMKNNSIGNRVR